MPMIDVVMLSVFGGAMVAFALTLAAVTAYSKGGR